MFILTNDDGIDAPGLRSLHQALENLASPVTIVAPLHHHSGCSHQVTTHRPIAMEQRSPQAFAIDGTPVDCTRIALSHLCPEAKFVFSGINAGGNLGADVYISGTVAAVREAALHRIPGIAISHYIRRGMAIDWQVATRLTQTVLQQLMNQPLEAGCFWNVNLPHLAPGDPEPEIMVCPLCSQPLPAKYELEGTVLQYVGDYQQRSRDPGADVEVCFSGNIAVTPVRVSGNA
ncbi:MAG: 5'/3'-nucleotidase SurE [Oculatellaceae cyanobacterium Prado106]|jgi:5'-nucleotidase|nr:5'/3'-nucleotidase SurE [Oculatellaceae cyanobacterium Prado106]